ncbi:lysophospholipid acyltransferase family protein [Histidinibacterium aquaticum]|uniref:1-acyl-sn-glycerol-3-phosphate acyltransferase n=1 Tax=Histidinibacterium aquaticum TaxID=2613962 RepID=A0A5J5GL69_9RHOB|nr:lysophospholipid acyltransferase family protein [Histidinibacterium aquaticum]KAA9008890.1 1-acyl-sn-glycerol-3-phosphate acyltransferase [Histidinibacterium aquaticum]
MSQVWHGESPPPDRRDTSRVRAVLRGGPIAAMVFGGLVLLLAVRLVERPLYGQRRPVTPRITCAVCRGALRMLGLDYRVEGQPMEGPGAVVANHASWLDIFALNAGQRIYFVSKDEVRGWPGVGWLARATGTIFIRRDRRAAGDQVRLFETRLSAGHKLLFFPEGTSTDGRRVLPFKPTLFAAFFAEPLRETLWVQPVSLVYRAPDGSDARFYGWWGGMDFAPHLMDTLGARRQGGVTVVFHDPLKVSDFADRKALSRACEAAVRGEVEARLDGPQAPSSETAGTALR